jgi:hypothetical protein
LYFRAFAPKGRPPDAPDMTTWAIGELPGRDSHPLDRCCYGLHQKTGPSACDFGEVRCLQRSVFASADRRGEGDVVSAGEGDVVSAGEGDVVSAGEGDVVSAGEGDVLVPERRRMCSR